jgi:polyisoprenoid-binding protein YceI
MKTTLSTLLALVAGTALAAPASYKIDPSHTYPSFEADHMGGLSVWRGKFRNTAGTIQLDAAARSGAVDITVDTTSIDFGYDKLNVHVKSADMFDVEKFPTATYKGTFSRFKGQVPTEVTGELTLHGVTKPVKLVIGSFLCKPNPMTKIETCGADASAVLDRADFGIDYGKAYGFSMKVKLAIQVEAAKVG